MVISFNMQPPKENFLLGYSSWLFLCHLCFFVVVVSCSCFVFAAQLHISEFSVLPLLYKSLGWIVSICPTDPFSILSHYVLCSGSLTFVTV